MTIFCNFTMAAVLAFVVAKFASAAPVLENIVPSEGSLLGGTMLSIHGRGEAHWYGPSARRLNADSFANWLTSLHTYTHMLF